jgi:hypothetical protein
MNAHEIIQKYFSPEEFKPTTIEIVDHFAIGCVLTAQGRVTAGLKMVNGALRLANCKNSQHFRQVISFVQKNPKEAFQMVRPHMEIMSLFPK